MTTNSRLPNLFQGALFGLGAMLLLTSAVTALESQPLSTAATVELEPNLSEPIAPPATQEPYLTAELRNYCNANDSLFLRAETQNFWVNICGGDLPHTYVGVDKSNGSSIRLALHDYAADGSWFEAWNGNYSYMLIFGTARGSFLTVTEGDRTIVQEPLINWD